MHRLQRGVNLFKLSWEKVSARLPPATAGHARLVLSKQLEQIDTSLYLSIGSETTFQTFLPQFQLLTRENRSSPSEFPNERNFCVKGCVVKFNMNYDFFAQISLLSQLHFPLVSQPKWKLSLVHHHKTLHLVVCPNLISLPLPLLSIVFDYFALVWLWHV